MFAVHCPFILNSRFIPRLVCYQAILRYSEQVCKDSVKSQLFVEHFFYTYSAI